MPLTIPPDLKKITPFIRRAEELDGAAATSPESRLVAYYLRQYAVQQGIPLASTSAPAKACLGEILGSLESEKAAMDNFTKEEATFLCRQFANKVFERADTEDRAGKANKGTARTFYAAGTFLQILDQFEDDEEDRKKMKYAKWKATEIINAFKEGRTPTPGGYGEQDPDEEEDDDEENEDANAQASGMNNGGQSTGGSGSASPTADPFVAPVSDNDADEEIILPTPPQDLPSLPTPPPVPPPYIPPPAPDSAAYEPDEQGTELDLDGNSLPPPPAYPGPTPPSTGPPPPATGRTRPSPPSHPSPPPAPVPAPAHAPSGGWFGRGRNNKASKLSKAQWADAMELTRFALAAMEDKNEDIAVERLQQALQTLGR